jgi:hypothetical protein
VLERAAEEVAGVARRDVERLQPLDAPREPADGEAHARLRAGVDAADPRGGDVGHAGAVRLDLDLEGERRRAALDVPDDHLERRLAARVDGRRLADRHLEPAQHEVGAEARHRLEREQERDQRVEQVEPALHRGDPEEDRQHDHEVPAPEHADLGHSRRRLQPGHGDSP